MKCRHGSVRLGSFAGSSKIALNITNLNLNLFAPSFSLAHAKWAIVVMGANVQAAVVALFYNLI